MCIILLLSLSLSLWLLPQQPTPAVTWRMLARISFPSVYQSARCARYPKLLTRSLTRYSKTNAAHLRSPVECTVCSTPPPNVTSRTPSTMGNTHRLPRSTWGSHCTDEQLRDLRKATTNRRSPFNGSLVKSFNRITMETWQRWNFRKQWSRWCWESWTSNVPAVISFVEWTRCEWIDQNQRLYRLISTYKVFAPRHLILNTISDSVTFCVDFDCRTDFRISNLHIYGMRFGGGFPHRLLE